MIYFLFAAGVVLLIGGAEALVRGASRLASAIGIPTLIVGLTVVAFGTSSPEFAVSLKAVFADQASVAVGNIIGSNIFNVLLILGLSAIVAPLTVSQQLVRFEVPLMIGLSAVVLVLGLDLEFGRLDGMLLFAGLIGYLTYLIVQHQRSGKAPRHESVPDGRSGWAWNVGLVVGGLGLLILGSRWLVDSAVEIATQLGVSELVIGLTIIAAGTSLPEVVTSVIATMRGERDIAVGNVVGSNLFNLMGVLGLAGMLAPEGIRILPAVTTFDLPVMVAAAFACLPIFFTGGVISRWEGAVLVGYYAAYTLYLVFAATAHDALDTFGATMLYFVIPLTVVTLGVLVYRAVRGGTDPGAV